MRIEQIRWLPARNNGTDNIPPGAAVERMGYDLYGNILVRRPTTDNSATAYINSDAWIMAANNNNGTAGVGVVTNDFPAVAKLNTGDGIPANGEYLGTRAGYFELFRGYTGFIAWGGGSYDPEKIVVQRDSDCIPAIGRRRRGNLCTACPVIASRWALTWDVTGADCTDAWITDTSLCFDPGGTLNVIAPGHEQWICDFENPVTENITSGTAGAITAYATGGFSGGGDFSFTSPVETGGCQVDGYGYDMAAGVAHVVLRHSVNFEFKCLERTVSGRPYNIEVDFGYYVTSETGSTTGGPCYCMPWFYKGYQAFYLFSDFDCLRQATADLVYVNSVNGIQAGTSPPGSITLLAA